MRLKLFIVALFSMLLSPVWGNGGGVHLTSSAFRSGNPVCRKIKDINLLSEKLQINILPDGYCEVTVKYVLWNTSDKDYKDIDYAFPIDNVSLDKEDEFLSIKNVFFSCNGQTLDFVKSESAIIPQNGPEQLEPFGGSLYKEYSNILQENDLWRRWYYTRFSVEKYSIVNLEVRYTYRTLQWSDGSSPMYMDYDSQIGGLLLYDFSPASSWGDGLIRDFYVEVNLVDLPASSDHYDYGLKQYKGIDFQQENENKWVYRTRNFDLKKAQPLFISYCVGGTPTLEVLQRFLVSPKEYSVKTSQQQKAYPITNICDMNLTTAWVGKVGDWIEFTFDSDNVIGFCIVNGYQKSSQTYNQNSRVKALRVDPKLKGQSEEVFILENQSYEPVYFENLLKSCFWQEYDVSTGSIKTIRFTIDEVYPGTKYDDTCISEILFFKSPPPQY